MRNSLDTKGGVAEPQTPRNHADGGEFDCCGVRWRIGRNWGVAHPKHQCWCSGDMVWSTDSALILGIGRETRVFDGKEYPWKVGYVSSVGTFKYGEFTFRFVLPKGRNLWPALWLTDARTWPPEIDVVEGWTNDRSDKHPYRKYSRGVFPIFGVNKIFPGLVTGDCIESKGGKSYYNFFHGTCSRLLDTDGGVNECRLVWLEDSISVYYNAHKVMEETDPGMLGWFNRSGGMEIHINNYVTNDFSEGDFDRLCGFPESCLTASFLRFP